jgi:hypothetical protein
MSEQSKTTNLDQNIAEALCAIIRRLTDDPDLLSVIGSYKDTLTDDEVYSLLKGWLNDGRALHAIN